MNPKKIKDIQKKELYCFHCGSIHILAEERFGYQVYNCKKCGATDGRAHVKDLSIVSIDHDGVPGHITVGALLFDAEKNKYLLMKKRTYPFFVDVIAGHVDLGETPQDAVGREVHEELGLEIEHTELIWEGLVHNDFCRRGISIHYWYVFFAYFSGELHVDPEEVLFLRYYSAEELLTEMELNPAIKTIVNNFITHK